LLFVVAVTHTEHTNNCCLLWQSHIQNTQIIAVCCGSHTYRTHK